MKKALFLLLILILSGCSSQEMIRVRQMDIRDVDIQSIKEGDHLGAFSYSGFEYKVKTVVSDHKIVAIEVLQNKASKRAKRAEEVLPEIIKRQTPNVDAVSGATTTSKALMKAVENSLNNDSSM